MAIENLVLVNCVASLYSSLHNLAGDNELRLIFTLYYCFHTNFHSYIIVHYIIAVYPTGKSSIPTDRLPVGYILQYHVKLGLNQKFLLTDKSFIAIDESSPASDDSFVATEGLPVGYILQYQAKLGKNQKFVTIYEPFIATYESSAAPDDPYVATYGLPIEYMLQYQAKLGQNQKFVQTESITIVVDCCGEWIEKNNRLIWRWKDGDMLESVLMSVQRDILYNNFVNSIISYCGVNCQSNILVISYMHKSFENQRVLPFKISNQLRFRAYLRDPTRFVLRVYVVEKPIENENVEQNQQNLLNDELNRMKMNMPDDEIGHDLKQLNNLQEDETGFYIGMTFKNKEELVTSLHIACLKKDFRLAKVINSCSVYYFKCAHPECKW
ncbi:hypothetical protein H5410_031724 [Solanum commersonii]|uniref:Uncharacterized protein n=1 Tax=Solanum commersonii TaxID=4109 RepID=A0A9J5YJ29_SOLCO|nr:hypothetical protein H5410_031724 [Solanum commersonii]